MDNRRRYVFRGNAAAFGGHIVRPSDIVIEAHGASSLPVTGGRSVSRVGPPKPNDFFHVDSAETFAEGLFEDHDRFREFTLGKREQDSLVAVTRVFTEVNGFAIGKKFRLTVKRMRAEIVSRSPLASSQPSVRIADAVIEGIDINGHQLKVELDPKPFQKYDTHSKLLAACDDPDFVEKYGDALFLRTPREGGPPPPATGRVIEACGTTYAHIVRSIKWDGPAFPGSAIEGNSVNLEPEFGRVFFGELLLSEGSRRLTLVRVALGSEGGGSASAGDAETNGSWSP